MKNWYYDEFKHCGVNYSNAAQAANYDNQHNKFRDYEKEFISMLDFISLEKANSLTMIDLGCGTGAASIYAAKKFRKVYGIDISDEMINQAKAKAQKENITNLEFIKSGFLNYKHEGEAADLLITKAAFHHLPDFWKQIALLNMNKMLKKEGMLYILDVVFNFEPKDFKIKIDRWIDGFKVAAGEEFKEEVEAHIRNEFSTFTWILEGMVERAGFNIIKSKNTDGFITEYLCIKN